MSLTPAAQKIVDEAAERFPGSMSSMAVPELRSVIAAIAVVPTTDIHDRFDMVVPTPVGDVPIRVFRPSDDPKLPVMLWFHSGGFVIGGLDQNEEYLRKLSNAADIVVVSVDYRLAPEHPYPAALDDARGVWEWVVSSPPELQANGSKAILAGESAGGNLTFALSQQLKDLGSQMPSGQIIFYGAADLHLSDLDLSTSLLSAKDHRWFYDLYTPRVEDRSAPYVCPALASDFTGLPPTLIATAEVDLTRESTESYARRLVEAGVDVDCERYEGVMHGFATMTGTLEEAARLFDKTVSFVRRVAHD